MMETLSLIILLAAILSMIDFVNLSITNGKVLLCIEMIKSTYKCIEQVLYVPFLIAEILVKTPS